MKNLKEVAEKLLENELKLKSCPFCKIVPEGFGKDIRNEKVVHTVIHREYENGDFRCPLNQLVFSVEQWNTRAIPDRTQIRKEVCEEILSGLPDPKDWDKDHNGWPIGWNNYREECIKVVLRVKGGE